MIDLKQWKRDATPVHPAYRTLFGDRILSLIDLIDAKDHAIRAALEDTKLNPHARVLLENVLTLNYPSHS